MSLPENRFPLFRDMLQAGFSIKNTIPALAFMTRDS
jgi:hypothetical protein